MAAPTTCGVLRHFHLDNGNIPKNSAGDNRATAKAIHTDLNANCSPAAAGGEPPSPQGEGKGNTSFSIGRFLLRAVFKINTPCSFPAHIAFPLRGRCRRSRRMRCLFKSNDSILFRCLCSACKNSQRRETERECSKDNLKSHRSGCRKNEMYYLNADRSPAAAGRADAKTICSILNANRPSAKTELSL